MEQLIGSVMVALFGLLEILFWNKILMFLINLRVGAKLTNAGKYLSGALIIIQGVSAVYFGVIGIIYYFKHL
jgi:hypothetical protein